MTKKPIFLFVVLLLLASGIHARQVKNDGQQATDPDLATRQDLRSTEKSIQNSIHKTLSQLQQENEERERQRQAQIQAAFQENRMQQQQKEDERLDADAKAEAARVRNEHVWFAISLSGLGIVLLGVIVLRTRKGQNTRMPGLPQMTQDPNGVRKSVKRPEDIGIDPLPNEVEKCLISNGLTEASFTTVMDGMVFQYTAFMRDGVSYACFPGQKRDDASTLPNRRKAAKKLYSAEKLRPVRGATVDDLGSLHTLQ